MKRFALFIILLTLTLVAACGSSDDTASTEEVTEEVAEEVEESSEEENSSEGSAEMLDELTLTMGGASPSGFWSLLGNGIGAILTENVAKIQYSYETGNGVKNVIDVNSGELPVGIAFNFEVSAALAGDEPFDESTSEVTTLATLYNNSPVQIVITKAFSEKYGIESLEDIAEKQPPIKVGVNQRGNLSEKVNRTIFEAYGFTYEDIEEWGGEVFYETYKPAADMMKDNKVDLIGVPAFAPDGKFLELSSSTDLMLLSLNEDAQNALETEMGLPKGVLEAGKYDFQPDAIETSDAGAFLLADPNMSNDEAYTITRVLAENIEQYKQLHVNLEDFTLEDMANVEPATLHPGAEIYYKEIGVLE